MIWLIDYTTYMIAIDPVLKDLKAKYFRVKGYKRNQVIGNTAVNKTMTYSNGLLRIATLLKQNGVECKYLHYPELIKILKCKEDLPEIIAFSTVCPTIPYAAKLAEKIKKLSPSTKVFVGGPQVNNAPQKTSEKFPIFDKLTVGHEIDAASAIADMPISQHEEYIDFSLLPFALEEYAINTFTALGCPFHCDYCADGRAPKICVSDTALLSQMKCLPKRKLIHIFDSVFGYSTERAITICKNLQKLNHGFLLSCDMRAELLTEQLVHEMEKAGFVEIRLGIESADEELLMLNKRTLSPKRCIETLKMIRGSSNLYITLYSVTGLPGTTILNHERTLDMFHNLLVSHQADEIKNALYVPYPYDDIDYSTLGIRILDSDWSHYDRQSFPVFDTNLLSRDQIWELYLKTAQCVADSWLESLGFSDYNQIPIENNYNEYIQTNYMLEK